MDKGKKRLLILGGTRISLQILRAAKSIGLEVYVADYNEDSPCKEEADKSFLISATDIDGIVALIKQEKIDGVIMGYADVLLNTYVDICEKAVIPCYANKKAIEITADKLKFKEYCKQYDIPVVKEYTYDEVLDGTAVFPLIVKPVDNSGARGIFICHDLDEFKSYYEESKIYSRSGRVIIERLMQGEEATIFYYLHDGEIYLLGIGDRWMYEQNYKLLKLPIGYTFPSRKLPAFLKSENKKIIEMFKSLDMKEGMVFIQCFVEGNNYVVYEMGYRLTGSIEHHLFEAAYGFNHLKAILNYAVGNDIQNDIRCISTLDPQDCCMANVSLLLKEGQIDHIEGLEKIKDMPGVIDYHVSHIPGESIDENVVGKLAQLGIRILIIAESRAQLLERMDKVKNNLKVISRNGEDMIIKDYSYQQVCQ